MGAATQGALRHRIKARVFLLVGVGLLGPLAVIGFARDSGRREFERRALAESTLRASFLAERLEGLLRVELKSLQEVAEAHEGPRRRLALREAWVRQHALFDAVFLIDAQGKVIAQEPATDAAADGARALAEAAREGRPGFTDLITSGRGAQHAYAVIPIRDWSGQLQGAVGGVVDPKSAHLAAVLKSYHPEQGETVDAVDGAGAVLASSEGADLLQRSAAARAIAAQVSERRGTAAAFLGADREREVVAFASLSLARWGVVVRQPYARAMAFSDALSRQASEWSMVALALALFFAWAAARSVTRPLATLTRAAERITAGDLERPIPELGDDEVGRLGRALETMRAALDGSVARIERANDALERRVAERTSELRAREETVRQLFGKVIRAQEDERRRIARELHDETTQSLAALGMRLSTALAAAPEGEWRARLTEAKELAVHTLEEVHRMIMDLRPSVLDDLGLKSAVIWYAQKHLEPLGIAVRCEFAGLDGRLPPQTETVIFRVVQEALSNAAKHAHASSVLLQAQVKDGELDLEIEDDGKGFDPAAMAAPSRDGSGWGLIGMRERVEMLGGKLSMESAPGEGTHLTLAVPLPQREAAHG